jgi:hypothetical protein
VTPSSGPRARSASERVVDLSRAERATRIVRASAAVATVAATTTAVLAAALSGAPPSVDARLTEWFEGGGRPAVLETLAHLVSIPGSTRFALPAIAVLGLVCPVRKRDVRPFALIAAA